MRKIDLVGQKFGRLTVIAQGITRGTHILWVCNCECGTEGVQVEGYDLRQRHTQSCGCYQKEQTSKAKKTHGMRCSREYNIWCLMWGRCINPNVERYPNYGGRGITVCERWKKFEAFYADMGPCPDGYSIERVDTNGNYEPLNCVWGDLFAQAKNRRQRIDNKSGCTGVFMYDYKDAPKWVVTITRKRKRYHLGYFDKLEDAVAVRKAAEYQLDYTPTAAKNSNLGQSA